MTFAWSGVFPAVTTKFKDDESLDFAAMERHFQFQLDAGVHGLIVVGSLGENGVLTFDEKLEILKTALAVADGRVPVLATIAETTTRAARAFAEQGAALGADGFMVLPGMRYTADDREVETHLRAVADASDRPIMLYNNPVTYGMDLPPEMLLRLADEPKFVAVKESSDDVRRVTDIINLCGDRYRLFCGVDNLAMESLLMGSHGWVAGLVCAFPHETVAVYNAVCEGNLEEARRIYRWFMPLLHLDVHTKLVQNIKLAETLVGVGTEHVRAPRLPLTGREREAVTATINAALAARPLPVGV